MNSATAFPYKTVPAGHCEFQEWELGETEGQWAELEDVIAGWDYDRNLRFRRRFSLQPADLLRVIGLADKGAELALVISGETGPTGYRWEACRLNIDPNDVWKSEVNFSVDSTQLAERITLRTDIVLRNCISEPDAFSAHLEGSKLFSQTHHFQLEGTLGRFPMDMVDFGKDLTYVQARNALWYLDWDPFRPDSHFMGTVRLYINSAHEELAQRIVDADQSALSVLRCDVIRNMCQTMLLMDDFLDNYASYADGSVGGQVREWLTFAFGEQSPSILQKKLERAPGRFETELQSAFS